MSCTNVVHGFVTSRKFYSGVNRFRQDFTCGRCASCASKARTDWRVRSYYECLDTLNEKENSFILFDTLTYSDSHIKRYSDLFPDLAIPKMFDNFCFSREDVQKFFKRLRISLKRSGYDFRPDQLRYILTSEFGSSERTRGFENTHRPHYHVLFFVSFPINPVEFSRFVSRAWFAGKTDGVKPFDDCSVCHLKEYCKGNCLYHSSQYVINERLVSKNTKSNLIKCVNYVTKYVSKDLYFDDLLRRRVESLFNYLLPDYRTNIFSYRVYRRFLSQVLPFHLQSIGFGASLMNDASVLSRAIETGKVILPTGKKDVVCDVALPRYYQRKLFYDFERVDGKVRWKLNDFGVRVKLYRLDKSIVDFENEYKSFDSSLSSDRLRELSVYNCVYRGTLTDVSSLSSLNYYDYFKKLISPHDYDEIALYVNRNTHTDKLTIGSFISDFDYVDYTGEVIFEGKQLHKDFKPKKGYILVSDKVKRRWNGFDLLLNRFERWKRQNAFNRDVVAYDDAKTHDYYKQLGLVFD